MKQPEIEYYQDERREWRWRVRAVNGRIVADSSEGYKTRLDCVAGYQAALTAEDNE